MKLADKICKICPWAWSLRKRCYGIKRRFLIERARRRYAATLKKLRGKYARGEQIRVLFLLNENSKWKCQSLYDAMASSVDFLPLLAITRADVDWKLPEGELSAKFEANKDFCRRNGLEYVEACAAGTRETRPLADFSSDIVFYTNPWSVAANQHPQNVSAYALTFYVPYYLVCYDAPEQDSQMDFHRFIYRYVLPSRFWADYFESKKAGLTYAGEMVGLGHPMLDVYSSAKAEASPDDCVIYAPHWSIPGTGCENYSTFMDTGRHILDYAKRHREIAWCFKPHPTLRQALCEKGGWTRDEVDRYYSQWEALGVACYDGSYPDLFLRSRAMITDCSSFLVEYSSVNRPLIHLVTESTIYKPAEPSKVLFESFYSVRTVDELDVVLKQVLEDGIDPKRSLREEAIAKLNLWHVRSAGNIIEFMRGLLRGK